MNKYQKPTDSELEILNVLWEKGQATVREVHERLLLNKDCGYTTTLKLMQIMFEKGLVSRNDSSKTHIYRPLITREKTRDQFINKMVDTLFAGSTTHMVMQALGNHTASDQELDEIIQLLQDLKNK